MQESEVDLIQSILNRKVGPKRVIRKTGKGTKTKVRKTNLPIPCRKDDIKACFECDLALQEDKFYENYCFCICRKAIYTKQYIAKKKNYGKIAALYESSFASFCRAMFIIEYKRFARKQAE